MARKTRIVTRGLTHHVYSRCIEKRSLLSDEVASDLLVEILCKTQEKYNFKLDSYQILDDHFHFVITTVEGGASISRIMQYFKARYAERYNALTGRIGPFWNERFKDVIIQQAENPKGYLLWLLWYLAFNPVRKGMVKNPREYRYSSINSYLNENFETRVRITLHEFFIELGDSFKKRLEEFLYYEETYAFYCGQQNVFYK